MSEIRIPAQPILDAVRTDRERLETTKALLLLRIEEIQKELAKMRSQIEAMPEENAVNPAVGVDEGNQLHYALKALQQQVQSIDEGVQSLTEAIKGIEWNTHKDGWIPIEES